MLTAIATKDTAETISVPAAPPRDYSGDGYDWLELARNAGWTVIGSWGEDGYDLGSWPYIIFAFRRHTIEGREYFGYCTYVEGDVDAYWFADKRARELAVTKDAFWYWKSGQADGPEDLPASAGGLPHELTVPCH